MKKSLLFAALFALTAPLAAQPTLDRVPAEADLVCVGVSDPALSADIQKAWLPFLEQAGASADEQNQAWQDISEKCPQFQPLLKAAFGYNDDFTASSTTGCLFSAKLPTLVGEAQAPKEYWMYAFVDNPKADLPAMERLMGEAIAAKAADKVHLEKRGDWCVLKPVGEWPEAPFIGWRGVEGGWVFALAETQAKADDFLAGKVPTLQAGDKLAEVFKAPAQNALWCSTVINGIPGLLERYLANEPEARQQLLLSANWLFKLNAIRYDCSATAERYAIALALEATDAESAALLRDQLVTLKALLGQMLIPTALQKPDAALAKPINDATVALDGNVATATITLTPAQLVPIIEELEALQARQQAMPLLDIEPAAEDQGEPMSEEEAKAILDGLELDD